MASKHATYETNDGESSLSASVLDILLHPIEFVSSRGARRAYLTTFLVAFTSTFLLGTAVAAYILFYWNYIPPIGFERTIYLQWDNTFRTGDARYDAAGNPYGIVSLYSDLVSMQRYDVFVELALPRTRDNRDAGNFMLEATMYAPDSVMDPVKDSIAPGMAETDNRLAVSRRPAILSYRSPIVESLYKLTELHWYLLGWRKEAESLKVSIWEGIEFARGWRNVPSTMKLEIQSTNRMQIYSAKAIFRARFRGFRWAMYNHRIASAFVFIGAFWTTEMIFAGAAWAAITFYLSDGTQDVKSEEVQESAGRIKAEGEEDEKTVLSDTERTFPSTSKQQALRYESPQVKEEEDDDAVVLPEPSSRATEADDEEDEEEDADVFLDSGIGTSLESSAGHRDSVRKRRGRTGSGDVVK